MENSDAEVQVMFYEIVFIIDVNWNMNFRKHLPELQRSTKNPFIALHSSTFGENSRCCKNSDKFWENCKYMVTYWVLMFACLKTLECYMPVVPSALWLIFFWSISITWFGICVKMCCHNALPNHSVKIHVNLAPFWL